MLKKNFSLIFLFNLFFIFLAYPFSHAKLSCSHIFLQTRDYGLLQLQRPLSLGPSNVVILFGLNKFAKNQIGIAELKDFTYHFQKILGDRGQVLTFWDAIDHFEVDSGPGPYIFYSHDVLVDIHSRGHGDAILFMLDGYKTPEDLFKSGYVEASRDGRQTDQELFLILSNRHYFQMTRWFRNGRELSEADLKKEFGKAAPHLFDDSLPYPTPLFRTYNRNGRTYGEAVLD